MSQVFKSRSSPAKLTERDLGESFRTAVIQHETHHVKALLKSNYTVIPLKFICGHCLSSSLGDPEITVDYVLDANRKTALYLASQYGHSKIVKTLLSHEANPNYRCADGSTSVHAACYSANPDIMSLLIDAGGDLRLHDNDGRGVKDWALKHIDKKKARTMVCFIEELYNRVMDANEDGDSPGVSSQSSSLKKKLKYPTNSKNAVSLQNIGFGRVRRGQFTYPGQRTRLVEVANWSEEQTNEPSLIPVITEASLVHDHVGATFTNGPFMIMESMYWNQFITVTVKRLRKISMGQESGRVDELINENNYMLRLKHASILLLLAVCPVDRFENIVLIYERVELGSLHMLLHHAGMRFSRRSTCSMFMQICDAVLYLHQSKMIHSYISDHAVMIMSSSHVAKLTNFEYMVDSDANDSSIVVTQTYPAAATKWLAPEILVDKKVSRKTDIYGICVVLWEVLHGRLPFAGLSTAEIEILLMDAQNRVLPIDAGIETPLKIILDSALKCDPSQRSCKIKDIQDLLEQAYAAVKIDKPFQLYKKHARSSLDASNVDCTLGCVLHCDRNGDLAELPKTERNSGLIEQREWRNKSGVGIPEQWEPGLTASDQEKAPEADLRHNMRLHKVSAVRKLFKDQAGLDDSLAQPASADEIKQCLLLLSRVETLGGESDGLGATDGDLGETEDSAKDKLREVDDLIMTNFDRSGTDAALLPHGEVENDIHNERGVTDTQDDIQDSVSDTDDEEGDSGVAETKLDANPIDNEDGVTGEEEKESGITAANTEIQEVVIANVEKSLTLGEDERSKELPLSEAAGEGIISASKCPMFSTVPGNDETMNMPLSFSGVDVVSLEQLPSFPVTEELIVPVKMTAKKILCSFQNEDSDRIKGDSTSAEGSKPVAVDDGQTVTSTTVDSQDSREVEPSESTVLTVQRVRRSILMLKRAFFSNTNLSDGTDLVASTSALTAAQTKKSSSDVSLPTQRLNHLSPTVKEIRFDLKSSNRDQPLAALSVDDQLLPKLSGELTADSMEKFKAMINKPLPPLPRTYIKQTQGQKQKSVANPECTTNSEYTTSSEFVSSEFDSSDWQRLSKSDAVAKTPLVFPRSRQTCKGHYAYVTSRVPTTVSFSGPSEYPPSGSVANLSKLGPSNHRVHEAIQPKTKSSVLYNGLFATHMGASRVYDKTSADRYCRSPLTINVDFLTGFKPASHHVPSMVMPHLSKRTNDCLIPDPYQRMPRRRSLRQEDATASYIGYRPDNDLCPGVRQEVSDNDSQSRDVVKGRLEKEMVSNVAEGASMKTEEEERRNDSCGRVKEGIPMVNNNAGFFKLFALSTQAFQNHLGLGPDRTRTAVKSTQVMGGKGATESTYKTINVKMEDVMGDNQIVTSKENDPLASDLEVRDTQRLGGVQLQNTEQVSSGARTLTRLAAMKAGTSLTIPPSSRISELQEEADFMHRFKSDPLLQSGAVMRLCEKSAKATELDKTSEEVTQIQQQVSPMTDCGNVEVLKNNMSEDFAVSDGDHAKVFKTSAMVCFQVKPLSSGLPDSRAKMTKEIEEGASGDEVSWLVECAILDALDQISTEYLISRCPHKANSTTADV